MDLTYSPSEQAFQQELRDWLAANHPGPAPAGEGELETIEWRREWQRRMHEAGWAGVHWPREFGGRGATLTESAIFYEELAGAGAPLPANTLGLLLGGPTLMVWGDEAQKERYLPPILSGQELWCQGFSEPEAGSDLAALKTRAVRDGDDWIVTGQKVWTSGAHYARWCMLLARTDFEAPKHKGITYFLLDMEAEGVQVNPLRQITGEAEFNELFLDEVRIPDEQVVGGSGNGWKVALTTLMNERAGLAFFLGVATRQAFERLVAELARRGRLGEATVRERLAEIDAQLQVLRLTSLRGLTATEKYGQPGPEGSLTKWMWSQANQRLCQLAVDCLGPLALASESDWAYELLRARGNTIEGGTTEILKNIVAERVLGLPRVR